MNNGFPAIVSTTKSESRFLNTQEIKMARSPRDYFFYRENRKCYYCGEELDFSFQLDHMDPKCQGGKTIDENLVASCGSCNASKHGRTVEEYKEAIKRRAYKMFSINTSKERKEKLIRLLERTDEQQMQIIVDAYNNFLETILQAEITFYGEKRIKNND